MCGFVAIISSKDNQIPENALRLATRSISHRGPDDEQILIKPGIGLGFRRLSINDLSNGNQPLWDTATEKALICNGEIYNSPELRGEFKNNGYSFKTTSDCEVLHPLYDKYGQDFVGKLEGMFAFVLVDFKKGDIFFARDRFGIKPLYIYQDSNWTILASEIKAILASGLVTSEKNYQYFYDCFAFGYSLNNQTYIKNIKAVMPASIGHLNYLNYSKPCTFRTYWRPSFPQRKGISELITSTNYKKLIKDKLYASVKSHLMSDVPVAAYLSGGLDSTITSLLMKANLNSKITTFSIGFEDAEFDESPIIDKTAQFADFDSIKITAKSSDISQFEDMISCIEMMQFSPMDIPLMKLSGLVRENNIKVVLCGEGSDEIFAGYTVFPWLQISRILASAKSDSIRNIFAPIALNFLGANEKIHPIFLLSFSNEFLQIEKQLGFLPAWLPLWLRRSKRIASLFNEKPKYEIANHPDLLSLKQELDNHYPGIDKFDAALFTEIKTRLPNYILQRTDRTSMFNSVEARVPFLDNSLVQSALDCPPVQKTFGFREKSVLRNAFRDILPSHFRQIRKFGYSAPNQWCWEPDGNFLIEKYLSADAIKSSGFFNCEEVNTRINNVRSAVKNNSWSLEDQEDAAFMTGVISMQILLGN